MKSNPVENGMVSCMDNTMLVEIGNDLELTN